MEIFGFSNMLGTGLQLLAASQGSKVPPLGGDSGPAEGIGFATKLARTFLSSQKVVQENLEMLLFNSLQVLKDQKDIIQSLVKEHNLLALLKQRV